MSYPTVLPKHPLPGRFTSRDGRTCFSKQDRVMERRELEDYRRNVWSGVASYYDRMNSSTQAFTKWSSDQYVKCVHRPSSGAGDCNDIATLREKLRIKLEGEEELLECELANSCFSDEVPLLTNMKSRTSLVHGRHGNISSRHGNQPTHPVAHEYNVCRCQQASCECLSERRRRLHIEAMQQQLQCIQERKEREHREYANGQMHRHWRLNNAILRQAESQSLSDQARKMWQQQMLEKQEAARREQERNLELERRECEKRQRELDSLNEREAACRQREQCLQESLARQMEERREREAEIKRLEREESEWITRQRELEQKIYQREQSQRERKSQMLKLSQFRQMNTKLRQRSSDIESALVEDTCFLDYLIKSGEREREKICAASMRADANRLRSVIRDQMEVEKRRRDCLQLMFNDDAVKISKSRESEWQKEELARKRLMQEVIESWSGQVKSQLERRQQDLCELKAAQEQCERECATYEQDLRKQQEERVRARQDLEQAWKMQIEEGHRLKQKQLDEDEADLKRQSCHEARELERLKSELERLQRETSQHKYTNMAEHEHRVGRNRLPFLMTS